ncbi:complex I NDUFA9 subunit family protein [Uliginosibacterium sp. sgz301328]|uniref:complex I NDUFA9 subunit family protein n=1 Tax=Uliginosibacterium sp. sgz301328 TaxID=3243764 RepID=UPI00359CF5E4
MEIRSVLLLGGTGFIGGHLANRLTAQGVRVVVPTRRYERRKQVSLLPTVEMEQADIHDPATLARLMADVDAVVNLVGVLHSRSGSPYGADFARAHVELPRKIVAACKAAGVPRLIHISALGAASDAPSEYLRSKEDGEQAIRAAGEDIAWTIFRPSVVFGPQDHFLNTFACLARTFPVLPLAGANTRMQPIHVEDVGAAIAASLEREDSFKETFELAGPRVYTLRELVSYASEQATGKRRCIVPLSGALASLQATVLGMLPGQLMTRDNLRSLERDSVASGAPMPFGLVPRSVETSAPAYLGDHAAQTLYNDARRRARRI